MPVTLDGSNLTTSGVINRGTAQASTSGTNIDFTVPIGATRITVLMNDVSLSGTASPMIRLGTVSGIESSAIYFSMSGFTNTAGTAGAQNYTTGFGIASTTASNSLAGAFTITNLSGNVWVFSGTFTQNTTNISFVAGRVTLSGALTQLRCTNNGSDTFDAGTINILYE